MKRLASLALAVMLVLMLGITAYANAPTYKATILFTHDLHSHLLPATDENGGQYGGYARLMTVIKEQKALYPDAILVDGGDFSMGSLFQTAYPTSAIELRMMGAMGYDATTFGNHEYDYLPSGFAFMLNAAANSGDAVPAILESNYLPPEGGVSKGSDAARVWEAFENYGVNQEYMLLQRGEVWYALFGLMGFDSDDCAPNSGMILHDPAETAQRIVDEARAACWEEHGVQPLVVCLSHSGTNGGEGEDYELAMAVDGIDIIVSGHTHTTLHDPIQVNDTYIVSAGEYGRYLGVVQVDYKPNGEMTLTDYDLIPVDEHVAEDPDTAALVESFKSDVEKDYLSQYGVGFDEVLVNNPYNFETVKDVYATQHESTLGNVFSDAYKWAVEQATGERVHVALTASGVIRESLPLGDVTASDVFNAASLGVGTEGELVAIYITGSDLMNALEVDASVQPLMSGAQLFMSGVEYSFNTSRMIFNKVDYAMLRSDDGSLEAIEPDELYRVVTGMYAGQMLGNVEATSMGLLTITPRDENGNPVSVDELVNYVVRDENGTPLKEWYAIASYLQQMGGEMDEQYAEVDGRKVVYSSLNPVKLLRNANKFTYILVAVILTLVLIVILISRAIVRKVRRKK
ncbi:MAG: bifunctional metallophosphatase/5'-nucleotidase [Oscillospiraceae bacterium]|nr:bifunctional metallophosphatase/5'-nucleotidase [Oscillospiraceae bacterium]